MKTYYFVGENNSEIFNQYNDWLENNQNIEVVATSLFQKQYSSSVGTSIGSIFLLITYKSI